MQTSRFTLLAASALWSLPVFAAGTWHVLPQEGAPAARYEPKLLWNGQQLVVFGPQGGTPTDVFDGGLYDQATKTWTLIPSQSWTKEDLLTIGWADGKLLAFTVVPIGAKPKGHAYDPKTQTWTDMDMSGVTNPTEFSPNNGKLQSLGKGVLLYPSDNQCTIRIYWADTNRWQEVPKDPVLQGVSYGTCPQEFLDTAAQRVYLVGKTRTAVYDIATSTWTTSNLASAFTGADLSDTSIKIGDKLFQAEGSRIDGFKNYVLIDPRTGAQTQTPPSPLDPKHFFMQPFVPLGEHVLFNWGSVQWSGGGCVIFPEPNREGVLYDARSNTWQVLPEDGAPSLRSDFALETIGTDAAVVFGGGTSDGAVYRLSTGKWDPIPAPQGYDTGRQYVWTGSGFYFWGDVSPLVNGQPQSGLHNDGLYLDLSDVGSGFVPLSSPASVARPEGQPPHRCTP